MSDSERRGERDRTEQNSEEGAELTNGLRDTKRD